MTTDTRRPLPDDIARCLDHSCPLRENCLSWLDRDRFSSEWVRQNVGVFLLESPRQGDTCEYQIPRKEVKDG